MQDWRRSALISLGSIVHAHRHNGAIWATGALAVAMAVITGYELANQEWRMLAVVAILGMVPIILRWPVVCTFGLYAFLVPFDSISALGGGLTVTRVMGLLSAAALLSVGLVEGRLKRPPFIAMGWAAFVLWGALTAAWAIEPWMVLGRLPTAVSLFGLYLVAVSFRVSSSDVARVSALYVAGGALAGVAVYVFGPVQRYVAAGRSTLSVAGEVANPNGVAAGLLLPLGLAIAALLQSRGFTRRTMALAAVAAIGLGIYSTMSRAAVLGLVVIVLVLLYRFRVDRRLVAAALLMLVIVAFMPETFLNRFIAVATGQDSTGSGRIHIWHIALQLADRYLVVGSGLSTFPALYSRYVIWQGSHNTYLGTLIEMGLIGLAVLLATIAAHFQAARPRHGSDRSRHPMLWATQAAGYAILLVAFFGDLIWTKYFWMLWIFLCWASQIGTESTSVVAPSNRASNVSGRTEIVRSESLAPHPAGGR